jgi:hypothetical protein
LQENLSFIEDLPHRLKVRTIMYIFRENYEKITFLKSQPESFLGWICPLLKHNFIPIEQHIYYETDEIEEIFFLCKGRAGFVLPFKQNIVYIEINSGDFFGDMDFVISASEHLMTIDEMIENLNCNDFNLCRQFTV